MSRDLNIPPVKINPEVARIRAVIRRIRYRPGYWFVVDASSAGVYLELEHSREDVDTGQWGTGRGGRRYLSPSMTDSDIIRVAFAAALAYEEHEVRETFTVDGARVFGPHISVDALAEVAHRLDIRPTGRRTDTPQDYVDRARRRLVDAGEDPDRPVYAQGGLL